jgi:hypothetical protein
MFTYLQGHDRWGFVHVVFFLIALALWFFNIIVFYVQWNNDWWMDMVSEWMIGVMNDELWMSRGEWGEFEMCDMTGVIYLLYFWWKGFPFVWP